MMRSQFTASPGRRLSLAAVCAIAVLLASSSSWAVILPPNAGSPTSAPPDALIGQWGDNASCVVIGPDLVLTTRHQGGGAGTIVQVLGASYTVTNVVGMDDPNRVDMQIAQLAGANFTQYAQMNTARNEVFQRLTVSIGGYGMGRGATLNFQGDANLPYGYAWDGSPNTTLRWGQNKLELATDAFDPARGLYESLLADRFDGPGSLNAVPGEAALADYDSGGGWLRQVDGNWFLVGLSWGVDHSSLGQAWFDDPNTAGLNPDYNYAIRISQYASWINDEIGKLDGAGSSVPEPASLMILAAGAAWLAARRRRRQA
jgi:hypothetical protein